MLAGRRPMVTTFYVGGVAKRDDGAAVARLAAGVDRVEVVALVHAGRLGSEAASAGLVEQRERVNGLVLAYVRTFHASGRSVAVQTAMSIL